MFRSAALTTVASSVLMLGISANFPVLADVSSHCQQDGYCLFSGTNFTGTMAGVPVGSGCRSVASLGIAVARSAARGYGDGKVLELFIDAKCATSAGIVSAEVANTSASAYRIVLVPG